jgi:predicted dehydrogenase
VTNRTPLRVGVLGVGIGLNYAEVFRRVGGAEVVALCASMEGNLLPATSRLGVPCACTDVGEMLERERRWVPVEAVAACA